jgi:hypothetical protein
LIDSPSPGVCELIDRLGEVPPIPHRPLGDLQLHGKQLDDGRGSGEVGALALALTHIFANFQKSFAHKPLAPWSVVAKVLSL